MKEIAVDNYEGVAHRDERLLRVIGYAQALADMLEIGELRDKAIKVEDDKGELVVTWLERPEPIEMQLFARAWASSTGDGSDQVSHYFRGEMIS